MTIPSHNYPNWVLDFKENKASDDVLLKCEENVFEVYVEDSNYIDNQKGLFANRLFKKGLIHSIYDIRRMYLLLLWQITF